MDHVSHVGASLLVSGDRHFWTRLIRHAFFTDILDIGPMSIRLG